uniref:Uncharacterized protein n=1 Tax=Magnetococcus massalia (strain MO-1) TaxID=451514 RepID=A0A1S7LEP4_MAGMO|nr:protein of unknown function [Candidatus Magnetococcus massalia]
MAQHVQYSIYDIALNRSIIGLEMWKRCKLMAREMDACEPEVMHGVGSQVCASEHNRALDHGELDPI